MFIQDQSYKIFRRVISALIAITFITSVILPPSVSAQVVLNLPAPGVMVTPTAGFTPALINGITIHPENPLEFDFIVGTGDEKLEDKAFEKESTRLIKYFMAALTVPEEEMWVNLSPVEKDRIIPQGFGTTEMGRDLLAQDYILKQLTASLMYPEKELGQKFWDKIYKKAKEQFGTTEIPVDTFNKVWIVPEKAVVYEHGNSAFVVKSHLKVMLEADYVALQYASKMEDGKEKMENGNRKSENPFSLFDSQSSIIKEIIVPAIEKEVNEGQTFAQLRQIYNSAILAAWFKQNLKESLLGQVYVDQSKTKGIETDDKEINQKIYNQYLEAFKKGVYNYIKEDTDPDTQEIIPRKYFSGGAALDKVSSAIETYENKSISLDPRSVFEVYKPGDNTIPPEILTIVSQKSEEMREEGVINVHITLTEVPEGTSFEKVEEIVTAAVNRPVTSDETSASPVTLSPDMEFQKAGEKVIERLKEISTLIEQDSSQRKLLSNLKSFSVLTGHKTGVKNFIEGVFIEALKISAGSEVEKGKTSLDFIQNLNPSILHSVMDENNKVLVTIHTEQGDKLLPWEAVKDEISESIITEIEKDKENIFLGIPSSFLTLNNEGLAVFQ